MIAASTSITCPVKNITRQHALIRLEARDGSAPNGRRGGLGGERPRYEDDGYAGVR